MRIFASFMYQTGNDTMQISREEVKTMEENKALLSVAETAAYLNLGKTKTRELMKIHEKVFVVRIGNRRYAHKGLLDKWLLAQVRQ